MTNEAIQQQLDRIERNSLLTAKKMLTVDDASLITGLSKSYLYKLTQSQQIPHYKPNGKFVYFDREDLEQWMRRNRVASQDEVESTVHTYLSTGKFK